MQMKGRDEKWFFLEFSLQARYGSWLTFRPPTCRGEIGSCQRERPGQRCLLGCAFNKQPLLGAERLWQL